MNGAAVDYAGTYDFLEKVLVPLICAMIVVLASLGAQWWKDRQEREQARTAAEAAAALEMRMKIAEARFPAYLALWRCMSPLSPKAPELLTADVRAAIDREIRRAYFDQGVGLLLPHDTLQCYHKTIRILNDPAAPDAAIILAFSKLRTKMKSDLQIYSNDEVAQSVLPAAPLATTPGKAMPSPTTN